MDVDIQIDLSIADIEQMKKGDNLIGFDSSILKIDSKLFEQLHKIDLFDDIINIRVRFAD